MFNNSRPPLGILQEVSCSYLFLEQEVHTIIDELWQRHLWLKRILSLVSDFGQFHLGWLVWLTPIVTTIPALHHVLFAFLSVHLSVRLGQPVLEGPDPSQHMAPFPRSQPKVDPHLPAALCPCLRVCGGHRLQHVRPRGDISLLHQLSYFLMLF